VSPERRAAVLKARDSWVGKLIDLTRRNKLLFFRDLKTGTLDLSKNDPTVAARSSFTTTLSTMNGERTSTAC
jgi:hypothetical protein